MKNRKLLRIGFTLGDINGVGPELLIRAFSNQRLKEICTPIIYGSARVLNLYRKHLSVDKFSYNVIQQPNQAQPRRISVIECIRDLNDRITIGKPNSQSGMAAFDALKAATDDLKAGELDGMVTMPIDKHFIQNDDFQFPGHTEYLAEAFEVKENLMFMVHEHLKVGVVTGHVPLKDVSRHLTVDGIFRKIQMMHDSLKLDFSVSRPRIAVLGLNPHAGDNGLLGKEEKEKISRAIEKASNKRMLVMGPYSADGFFGTGMFKKFDAVLGMYHDQGLIPFKLLAGFEGVNFTAGLPVVRTSPDHGPAFGLAGKGEADPTSTIHALYAVIDIVRRRRENEELTENSIFNNPPPDPKDKRRNDRNDRKDRNDRNDRNDRGDRNDKNARPERNERNDQREQKEPSPTEDQIEKVAKTEEEE